MPTESLLTRLRRSAGCTFRLAGLVLLVLLAAGCSGFDPGEPVLADSLAAEVLLDMHILEARGRQGHPLRPALRDSVLTHHGVEERQYEEALAYYAEHPDRFARVYEIVLRRMEAERYGDGFAPSPADSAGGDDPFGRRLRFSGRDSSGRPAGDPARATP